MPADPVSPPDADGVAPADVHRWRLTLDMTATSTEALASKLADLAGDLYRDQQRHPASSVFGSPSCSGVVTIEDRQETS